MNKLVIIGNGFDLAHGLKTSYKDFVLWYINKKFKTKDRHEDGDLITISTNYIYVAFKSLDEYFRRIDYQFKVNTIDNFFDLILNQMKENDFNWVDIEKKYFDQFATQIAPILRNYFAGEIRDKDIKSIFELNKSLDKIRTELILYLKNIEVKEKNDSIVKIFQDVSSELIENEKVKFLNFNYTSTIEKYQYIFNKECCSVNYIHGNILDEKNPIIFGYGDESNEHFEKIEKLNNNELTRNLKSFSYLTTSNYKDLFKFLDSDEFDVHVMGHSLGLSDRLLLNHIFEHKNFNKVQLYFYEYEKDGVVVNDFFQKTQELSRHFKLDAKHKMRTKVVPFSESKPLTKFKSQN